jgi:hypothetical protein
MNLLRIVYDYTLGPDQPIWINNGSNLTVFAVFGTGLEMARRLNCTQKGCWRLSLHKVVGTKYRTCHKHATVEIHDKLIAEHAAKHPEQHALLNR